MRYDVWDVILFPKDSHVPIQEFKTACYVSSDEYGRQLPTLTCYISSLPPSTPFRISVHSWATVARPSAHIESRRRASQKVVYTIQVIVDGAGVSRSVFEVASKWPQEIAHEKRSFTLAEQPSSQRKACLEFPPFRRQTLMQSSWDARDPNDRIKILLSEQLISKIASPGEIGFGATNEIVCFSFQHAPKDVLEQAGISWPIRNPLYLPNAHDRATLPSQTSPSLQWAPKAPKPEPDIQMQSPPSHASKLTFARPQNPEPHRRPHSHLPPISLLPKPPVGVRGSGRAGIWDDAFTTFGDSGDDVSMDTWSTKRTPSNLTGDMSMSDYMYKSCHPSIPGPPWSTSTPRYEQSASTDQRSRKEEERQLVVTLRDDQLGQIIEALSPPKRNRELPYGLGSQRHEQSGRPPTAHSYYPPKVGTAPLTHRPSSAAMARTLSYSDFNTTLRNVSSKPVPDKPYASDVPSDKPPVMYHPSFSSNKENCPRSQSRLPTPYPQANRVPTPNPFAQRLPTFPSDVSMRDPSSVFSSLSRLDRSFPPLPQFEVGKPSSAHAPSAAGTVKSRKDGATLPSPKLSDQGARHDASLLPAARRDASSPPQRTAKHTPALVEVIDVDAIDPHLDSDAPHQNATKLSPFKPLHRSGVSSIDSTGRLERQLFSALGEELASFDPPSTTPDMGPELARALGASTTHSDLGGSTMLNPSASEFEPTVKRKRQGTLGEGRDRSPVTKKKGGPGPVEIELEERRGQVVPRLRGY